MYGPFCAKELHADIALRWVPHTGYIPAYYSILSPQTPFSGAVDGFAANVPMKSAGHKTRSPQIYVRLYVCTFVGIPYSIHTRHSVLRTAHYNSSPRFAFSLVVEHDPEGWGPLGSN